MIPALEDVNPDELEALTADPPESDPVLGEGHSAPDLDYRAKSGLDTFPSTHPDA